MTLLSEHPEDSERNSARPALRDDRGGRLSFPTETYVVRSATRAEPPGVAVLSAGPGECTPQHDWFAMDLAAQSQALA